MSPWLTNTSNHGCTHVVVVVVSIVIHSPGQQKLDHAHLALPRSHTQQQSFILQYKCKEKRKRGTRGGSCATSAQYHVTQAEALETARTRIVQ